MVNIRIESHKDHFRVDFGQKLLGKSDLNQFLQGVEFHQVF